MKSHSDAVNSGTKIFWSHEEDRESDEGQDYLDDKNRDADTLDVLLGWYDCHQLLSMRLVSYQRNIHRRNQTFFYS